MEESAGLLYFGKNQIFGPDNLLEAER
jgi:hypothetical protein